MKDSGVEWMGEIPNSWHNDTIRRLLVARNGGAWGEDVKDKDEGIVCLRVADFDYSKGRFVDLDESELTHRKYSNIQVKRLMLYPGDICVEKSGGGEKTPVGRAVLFDKNYIALFANFMERLRFNIAIVLSEFAEYWFRMWYSCRCSPYYINQTTGIQNIDLTLMLAKEKMFFPNIDEQCRIADYLDAKCAEIDKVVEKTRETIEEYKKLKQSIITETVTKGLNPDAEMKDSGIPWIGKIPVEWKIGRVKDEFSVVLGKMLQTSPKSLNDTLENYACASNVKWSGYNADVSRKMWFSSTEKREYLLVNGDVLVMEGGTAGTSCIYQGENAPCYMQNSINRCRNMGGYPNKLLYYYLFHVFYCGYIESICNKSTIRHYTKEKIENTPLVIPENHEQLRIVSFLDAKCAELDNIIEKKERLIEELGSYKKSLIYEYVTGKKEVQA